MTQTPSRDWQKDMEMCEAATPGPWRSILEDLEEREYYPATYLPTQIKSADEVIVDFDGINLETEHCIPNAELMAEARTALPYWLQEAKERGKWERRLKVTWKQLREIVRTNATGGSGEDINDYDIMLDIMDDLLELSTLYPDNPAPKEGTENKCPGCGSHMVPQWGGDEGPDSQWEECQNPDCDFEEGDNQ